MTDAQVKFIRDLIFEHLAYDINRTSGPLKVVFNNSNQLRIVAIEREERGRSNGITQDLIDQVIAPRYKTRKVSVERLDNQGYECYQMDIVDKTIPLTEEQAELAYNFGRLL